MKMQCPGFHSADLDTTARCLCCGLQLSIVDELRLRAEMPAPKTRAIEDEKFDLAIREA